jgi:DNA primase small subunit
MASPAEPKAVVVPKLTEEMMGEYYRRIYPAELVCSWLSYDQGTAYLSRREFCFTLIGDIFTRWRSYPTTAALTKDLIKNGPEKIDVGAVYNVQPDKRKAMTVLPQERELVFDIDMSDYDKVRSCCKGKRVCQSCWTWMSTAAKVLRDVVSRDFGYTVMMPVFSGRRGVHLWICDDRARLLSDEERQAIVGYMTVMVEDMKMNITRDMSFSGTLHPTLQRVHDDHIVPAFERLFLRPAMVARHLDSEGEEVAVEKPNVNCIFTSPASAAIVMEALLDVEAAVSTGPKEWRIREKLQLGAGEVFSEQMWATIAKRCNANVIVAARFALMYPRLDENVSTRRDHLLKLPFCIHPGTGKLCVPLTWSVIDDFNPETDPPTIGELLDETGEIDARWKRPLLSMLDDIRNSRQQN